MNDLVNTLDNIATAIFSNHKTTKGLPMTKQEIINAMNGITYLLDKGIIQAYEAEFELTQYLTMLQALENDTNQQS